MKARLGILAVTIGVVSAGVTLMLLVIVSPAKIPFLQGALSGIREYAADLKAAQRASRYVADVGEPAVGDQVVGERVVGEQVSSERARAHLSNEELASAEAQEPAPGAVAPSVVAPSVDSTGRQTKTKELLEELAKYEEKILNDDGGEPLGEPPAAAVMHEESDAHVASPESAAAVTPGTDTLESEHAAAVTEKAGEQPVQEIRKDFYVASTDSKGSARLAEVLKQNETLSAQTEELAREVAKLRTIMAKARQVQELYVTERDRAKELEASLATCHQGPDGSASVEMLNTKNQELEHQLEARGGELKTCKEQLQTTASLADSAVPLRQELAQATGDLELLREENQILLKGGSTKAVQATRAKSRTARATSAVPAVAPIAAPGQAAMAATIPGVPPVAPAAPVPASDVPLIEVIADRASIRSGPGTENSSMMDVAKGSRLTVESQEGEWFHVVTPTGGRGYIHMGVVRRLGNQAPAAARRADMAPPMTTVASPLSQNVAPSGPAKPAARAAKSAGEDDALEPFGAVNVAGKPANDPESRARALMNSIRSRQAGQGPVPPEKFETETSGE